MSLDPARVAAIRRLIARVDEVGRVSGREPWREVLLWLSRGRWGRRTGRPVVPRLNTPWQDTVSAERPGWRMRAACRVGWVEQPYTLPDYQRQGLAAAGLAALRAEHPGFAWHTLGGHIDGSSGFWDCVGTDVPGGYRPRGVCPHVTAGG